METRKEDIRTYAPKALRNVKLERDEYAHTFECDTKKYHYVLYLTRVQGYRDELYKVSQEEWSEIIREYGKLAIDYILSWGNPYVNKPIF